MLCHHSIFTLLEYVIMRVCAGQDCFKLNGTHLLLVCANDGDDLVGENQWRTQDFFSGGVQQIQLRTEDRENRDLGAVAP